MSEGAKKEKREDEEGVGEGEGRKKTCIKRGWNIYIKIYH